jgi:hypothetical protein
MATCEHFYHSGLCHIDSRHPVCPIVTTKPPPAIDKHNGASIFGPYFSLFFYERIGWKARNSLDSVTTCTFFRCASVRTSQVTAEINAAVAEALGVVERSQS